MSDSNETAPAPARGSHLGMLKNPRWEAFAHAIARGSTIDAAYREAGYAPNRGNASRLNAVECVKRRVEGLQQLVQKLQKRSTHAVVLTQAWVIENLVGIVFAAKDQGDLAGANRALHLLGLTLGMFVERKEAGKPGEFDGLTIADKKERILAIVQQLGAPSPLL